MRTNSYQENAIKICLIAGEPSGDILGGKLMVALKIQSEVPIEFIGIGGERMHEEGLVSFFPIDEISMMGIFEIVPHIPKLLQRIKETSKQIKFNNPNAVITIDSPGFCLRIAKKLKGTDIRLIHYVAPSVWAWKPWRAKNMSKYLDLILTLFNFESPYFKAAGIDSIFVGHPVVESGAMLGDGLKFRLRNRIASNIKLICILPGSRLTEIKKHLPIIENTLRLLEKEIPNFQLVLPLAPNVSANVKAAVNKWPYKLIFTEANDEASKYDAFAACDVALACSGTVALELALADTPYVTIYKMSFLTSVVAKIFVKVKYVNIINILLDREIVPELILTKCKPHLILPKLTRVLMDVDFQTKQRINFRTALDMIAIKGQLPSERAAQAVLELVARY